MGVATPDLSRGSQLRPCMKAACLPPPDQPSLCSASPASPPHDCLGGGNRAHLTVHSMHSHQCYEKEHANRRAAPPFYPGHVCSPKAALRGVLLSGGTLQHTVPPQHQASPWAVETAARSAPTLMKTGTGHSDLGTFPDRRSAPLTTGKSAPLLPRPKSNGDIRPVSARVTVRQA